MASVLHITNIPTPYRLPLFREITRQATREGIDFRVHFLGLVRRDRRWRITEEDFEGIDYTIAARPVMAEAVRAIREARPSIVVLAWAMDLLALRLLLYCRRHGIACVVVSGETDRSAAANSLPALRNIFRRPFFTLAHGFVSYGTQSSRYLVGAGVPASRVTTGINVVDTSFFARRVDELRRAGDAAASRARYRDADGEEFACHLLFVGYLLAEKGGAELVNALSRLGRSDVALHVVGAGEQLEAMRSIAEMHGIGSSVFFHGYRQTSELPDYYAMADILIFPSLEEVYGLVMVEGAAAALPIIASRNAGGTVDVVVEGINGLVVDPVDTAALAGAIGRLAADPDLRRWMGEESRRRAESVLTVERSARCYLERITMVLGKVQ
jgi:glycosyltransferase involved in cell wall biosynthesis